MCLKAEKDVELALQMILGINVLRYDFTKDYILTSQDAESVNAQAKV